MAGLKAGKWSFLTGEPKIILFLLESGVWDFFEAAFEDTFCYQIRFSVYVCDFSLRSLFV